MRLASLFLAAGSLLAAGCSQHIVMVRLFDEKGKPVMDAAIAVEGKYICGYSGRGDRKEPVLKDFCALDEFTCGELTFGVWGLPDTLRLSADAPGFYKLISTARCEVQEDSFIEYGVVDANPPYDLASMRVKKKGLKIYVDAFLLQAGRGRR